MPFGLPVVKTNGRREQAGGGKVFRQPGSQSDPCREQLDRHVPGGVGRDVDDVAVQEGLPAREPQPSDARLFQIVDDAQDGRRVHPLSAALLVVAVLAILRTGVGQPHLRVRRPRLAGDEMMGDEPRVRAAGERRKVRMEDEVPPEPPHREPAHVARHEETGAGLHPHHAGIRHYYPGQNEACSPFAHDTPPREVTYDVPDPTPLGRSDPTGT